MVRGLDGYFLLLYPHLACAVFKLHRASRKIPVVHSERETPLPIPNRAVKPFSADGTWGATPWESRSPPVLLAARAFKRRGLLVYGQDLASRSAGGGLLGRWSWRREGMWPPGAGAREGTRHARAGAREGRGTLELARGKDEAPQAVARGRDGPSRPRPWQAVAVAETAGSRGSGGTRGASVTREPRIPHRRDTDP